MNKTLASLVTAGLTLLGSAKASVINGYNPARHNIDSPMCFISEDFSGVGTSGRQWATMISPSWALTADHAPAGGTILFKSATQTCTRVVNQSVAPPQGYDEDIRLVHLSEPVPDWVAKYPILNFPSVNDTWGIDIPKLGEFFQFYNVGWNPGRNTRTVCYSENYFKNDGTDPYGGYASPIVFNATKAQQVTDYGYSVSGDSGAPTFLKVGDFMYVVGNHHGSVSDSGLWHQGNSIDNYIGGSADVWLYQDAVNRTRITPEPTSLVPLALSAGALAMKRSKKGGKNNGGRKQ